MLNFPGWLYYWPAQTCCRSCFVATMVIFVEGIASPRSMLRTRCCALVRQAVNTGTALSSLYRTIFSAAHRSTQTPVRYVGVFTDGGADKALQQYGVDNMRGLTSFKVSVNPVNCLSCPHLRTRYG